MGRDFNTMTHEEKLEHLTQMRNLNQRISRMMGQMDYNISVLKTFSMALQDAEIIGLDTKTLALMSEVFIKQGDTINEELANLREEWRVLDA